MKVATGIGVAHDDWPKKVSLAVEAERIGVDELWSAENWAHDAVSPLAYLAALTKTIRLGSGIIQAPARSPAMIAMTALTLEAISEGRFILGLGASGPQVVEGWHGVKFNPAIQRIREVIDIVRIVSRGERLTYQGTVYQLPLPGGEGKALRFGAQPREVPIYVASLSPKSLEMTGELADGWVGTSFIPEHANVFLDRIRAGAAKAGRSLDDFVIQAPAGGVAITDDVERYLADRKKRLGFELGAMGSRDHNFYNDAYKRAGYAEAAAEVQRLWLDGKQDQAIAAIPDDMALRSSLIGTEEMVRERLRAYRDAGVHVLRADGITGSLEHRIETLARLVQLVREVTAEKEPTLLP